jgi:hypothetical protein
MPVPTRDGPARYEAAGYGAAWNGAAGNGAAGDGAAGNGAAGDGRRDGGGVCHGGAGGFLITLSPPFGQGPDACGDSYSRPRIAVPAGRLAHRKIIRG